MNNRFTRFINSHRLLTVLLCLAIILGLFVSRYSFITISVSGGNSDNFSYRILNQKTKKEISLTSKNSTIRKLVPKGNYETFVSQNDTSFFAVVNVKGFLRGKSVEASLTPEYQRSFVGDSPGACMVYTGKLLLSNQCGGSFSSTGVHVASSPRQSTYITKTFAAEDGTNEGMIQSPGGAVSLVWKELADEGGEAGHFLYSLSNEGKTQKITPLKGLSVSERYTVSPFRNGFIAFNNSYSSVVYYPSDSLEPEIINIAGANNTSLKPYLISSYQDSVAVAFSDKTDFVERSNPEAIGKVSGEVVVYANGSSSHHKVSTQFSMVTVCGTKKLCGLNNQELYVYDISSSDDTKLLFKVVDVRSISNTAKGLMAVTSKNILVIDVDSAAGYVTYSFGIYTFCGLQVNSGDALLCVADERGITRTLLLNLDASNNDSIDKKIINLTDLHEVSALSIYGNNLYIIPNLGALVYNSAIESFDHNPASKKSVSDAINKEIDSLGVDRGKYSIYISGVN